MSEKDIEFGLQGILCAGEDFFGNDRDTLFIGDDLPKRKVEALRALGRQTPFFLRPQQLVGYGFLAPEGSRAGRWQMCPSECFRASKIYAWGSEGERASLKALRFGADNHLVGSLPAALFDPCISPQDFLLYYGQREEAFPGFHRVVLGGLPGQPQLSFGAGLDFPTLSFGLWFEVEWTGPLSAFFVCGNELLPAERAPSLDAAASSPRAPSPEPERGTKESTSTMQHDIDRQGKAP